MDNLNCEESKVAFFFEYPCCIWLDDFCFWRADFIAWDGGLDKPDPGADDSEEAAKDWLVEELSSDWFM